MAILLLYGNVVRHPLRYIEVKDMSEKRVEDTNQKCVDVLVWVSFFSSTETGVLKKVSRMVRSFTSPGERISMGTTTLVQIELTEE